MANATQAVEGLLRSTDKIAWILDTGANSGNSGINATTQGTNARSRRILVIITHEEDDKESGGYAPQFTHISCHLNLMHVMTSFLLVMTPRVCSW
jgi:hypothetical protein